MYEVRECQRIKIVKKELEPLTETGFDGSCGACLIVGDEMMGCKVYGCRWWYVGVDVVDEKQPL